MILDKIQNIDVLEGLKTLEDESVQCCVTSPPYWNLRDYKIAGQVGLEKTPAEYIDKMVEIFREVKRVLKKDGTLWLNIGDSYAASSKNRTPEQAGRNSRLNGSLSSQEQSLKQASKIVGGLKPKDLVGIPWMLAFALRADGWYLRSDIVWSKKNVMPESVTDRPTRAHEYIFLLSKSSRYYYDHESIKEVAIWDVDGTGTESRKARAVNGHKSNPGEFNNGMRPAGFKEASKFNGKHKGNRKSFRGGGKYTKGQSFDNSIVIENETHGNQPNETGMRNKRDVWNIATAQFPEAHFATFPEEIPATCIKAGSKEGDLILDPFMGAGTTALVAKKLNRHFIGFELNPEYIQIAEKRLKRELGMFHKSVII